MLAAGRGLAGLVGSRSLGGRARLKIGGREAIAHGGAAKRTARLPHGERLLVAVEHLGGDRGPGEALGALPRAAGHARAQRRVQREHTQRLRERERVACGNEQAVGALAHDVAIAGDVRGDHRRRRGEGLGQHHAEALAAERGGAQHLSACELRALALLGDLAERLHAACVEHHVRDLLGACADERERGVYLLAQRFEGAQQHGQPLALDGLADEQDPQRPCGILIGARRGRGLVLQAHAVGDDAVAPAVEALRRPGGRFGDCDAHVQAVHAPAPAERQRGDAVREQVLGVGVEGADERQLPERAERVPTEAAGRRARGCAATS